MARDMQKKIIKHPMFKHAAEIADICQPITRLGISYFAHVHIDHGSQFSAMSNHPVFGHHYLKNHYYNADIHLAEHATPKNYILGDALTLSGLSKKINQEAMDFGVRHLFTIVKKNKKGMDFYHFATEEISPAINQVYITHLDLLELFVTHFNEQVMSAKELASGYDLKFALDPCTPGFEFAEPTAINIQQMRAQFLEQINFYPDNMNENQNNTIVNKVTNEKIMLSAQQYKCLCLLFEGLPAKRIADQLKLSTRTVENYLFKIRNILGCKNSRELLTSYNLLSSQKI